VLTFQWGTSTTTASVTLTRDPAADGPTEPRECFIDVDQFFFGYFGYAFKNDGDCVAYAASGGSNPALVQP
jgi:hypothetical protein